MGSPLVKSEKSKIHPIVVIKNSKNVLGYIVGKGGGDIIRMKQFVRRQGDTFAALTSLLFKCNNPRSSNLGIGSIACQVVRLCSKLNSLSAYRYLISATHVTTS